MFSSSLIEELYNKGNNKAGCTLTFGEQCTFNKNLSFIALETSSLGGIIRMIF